MSLKESTLNKQPENSFIGNVGWNLLGQLAPLAAALASIPRLIDQLGLERFGMLTIAWTIIGYFSLFDLGLGRALTRLISEKIALGRHADLPALIGTGLSAMLALGLLASLVIWSVSEWIAYSALKLPAALRAETMNGLYMLAPAIPLVLLATGLRGILEAQHAFRSINLVRIPLGILMFVAPLAVLPFSHSLVAVFATLLAVRALTAAAFFFLCKRSLDNFTVWSVTPRALPELLSFGGWMTISNIINPVMAQMDRFAIGAMVSMAAVAYYATPYEMITKFLLVPGAIAGVCFPQFARLAAQGDFIEAARLYARSCKYIVLIMLPAIAGVMFLADWLLLFWLGRAFLDESVRVFQILALGVMANGLAAIPFTFLQGAGRADLTAKVHVAELLLYLPLLYGAIDAFGIVGAALVWSLRVGCDGVILHLLARRCGLARGARPSWHIGAATSPPP